MLASATLLVGCSTSDHRLYGRWKSNKALSVASFHPRKPISPEKRAKFESIFGNLVIEYDHTHLTCQLPQPNGLPPYLYRSRYKIVASDDTSLVCISKNLITGKSEIEHIHFDGPNRYWIYLLNSGWKEYFDRIKAK